MKRYIPKLGAPLSRKQEALMAMVVDDGLRRGELVQRSGMAPATISMHLQRIKAKLGAKTPAQAAVFFDRQRRKA